MTFIHHNNAADYQGQRNQRAEHCLHRREILRPVCVICRCANHQIWKGSFEFGGDLRRAFRIGQLNAEERHLSRLVEQTLGVPERDCHACIFVCRTILVNPDDAVGGAAELQFIANAFFPARWQRDVPA